MSPKGEVLGQGISTQGEFLMSSACLIHLPYEFGRIGSYHGPVIKVGDVSLPMFPRRLTPHRYLSGGCTHTDWVYVPMSRKLWDEVGPILEQMGAYAWIGQPNDYLSHIPQEVAEALGATGFRLDTDEFGSTDYRANWPDHYFA
jgi:hypothetical protein